MKALVFEGKVVDLAETAFEVNPAMQWVDCDDSVEVGFTYTDGVFAHWDTRTDAEKAADALDFLRRQRNKHLVASDWTQAVDAPLTVEQQTAWQEYRQALRDITDTYSSIDDVVWPTKPE